MRVVTSSAIIATIMFLGLGVWARADDSIDVKETATQWSRAVFTPDLDAILRTTVPLEDEGSEWLRLTTESSRQRWRLDRLVFARFGKQARLEWEGLDLVEEIRRQQQMIEKATIRIDGDTAALVIPGAEKLGDYMTLRKIDRQWRVDVTATYQQVVTGRPDWRKKENTKAIVSKAVADRLERGDFSTVSDVVVAYYQGLAKPAGATVPMRSSWFGVPVVVAVLGGAVLLGAIVYFRIRKPRP